jgi:hypothetical protein
MQEILLAIAYDPLLWMRRTKQPAPLRPAITTRLCGQLKMTDLRALLQGAYQ